MRVLVVNCNWKKLKKIIGNGYPLVTHYRNIDLTPRVWEEMMDLILKIHTHPETLPPEMTVANKYSFGGWHLVYNELEDIMNSYNGKRYSSCEEFTNSD